MVYCVFARGVTDRLKRSIERGLRAHDGVVTLIERRDDERRRQDDRRARGASRPAWADRRCVRYPDGRRVAERRTPLVPVGVPEDVPRAVRQHSAAVSFLAPLEIPGELCADVEAVRAVVRFQAGHDDGSALYDRWFDPIFTYLAVTLDRGSDVEAYVGAVLAEVFGLLREAAPAPAQIRPWLFALAYDAACATGDAAGVRGAVNGHRGDRGEVGYREGEEDLRWLTDEDLLLLVGRRPPPERHVLVLRYFGGLSFHEIGEVMRTDSAAALALHASAVASLDSTLSAVTPSARAQERHPMERLIHQTPVLARRRRALLAV